MVDIKFKIKKEYDSSFLMKEAICLFLQLNGYFVKVKFFPWISEITEILHSGTDLSKKFLILPWKKCLQLVMNSFGEYMNTKAKEVYLRDLSFTVSDSNENDYSLIFMKIFEDAWKN